MIFKSSNPPKGSQIQFEAIGENFRGKADENLLRHILTNLLSNSVKYSPHGTPVKFNLTVSGNQAIFQVKDQGIGISEIDKNHLFEAFHRGKNVGDISGTGLGLMIAKQATEAHQGTITCASQLDAGTTFVVTLPFISTRASHD
jgi:signal transduction histidine kinase